MATLAQKKCKPCEGGVKPLNAAEAAEQLKQIPGWQASPEGTSISRLFIMKNFISAIEFTSQIAQVAEAENHHPDIHLTGYRKLKIDLTTHAIGGLSENDFIVAAKINELKPKLKE